MTYMQRTVTRFILARVSFGGGGGGGGSQPPTWELTLSSSMHVERAMPPSPTHRITYCHFAPPRPKSWKNPASSPLRSTVPLPPWWSSPETVSRNQQWHTQYHQSKTGADLHPPECQEGLGKSSPEYTTGHTGSCHDQSYRNTSSQPRVLIQPCP